MEFLTTQIKALPQVLQDLISEYNVHHRKQMNNVCRQLKVIQRDQYICDNLDCSFAEISIYRWISRMIYSIYGYIHLVKFRYHMKVQIWSSVPVCYFWQNIEQRE